MRSILDDCLCINHAVPTSMPWRPVTSPVLVRFYFATMTSGCELGRKRPAVRGQKHQTNLKNIPPGWIGFFTSGPKKCFSLQTSLETNIVYYTMTKASQKVLCFFGGKGEIKVDGWSILVLPGTPCLQVVSALLYLMRGRLCQHTGSDCDLYWIVTV